MFVDMVEWTVGASKGKGQVKLSILFIEHQCSRDSRVQTKLTLLVTCMKAKNTDYRPICLAQQNLIPVAHLPLYMFGESHICSARADELNVRGGGKDGRYPGFTTSACAPCAPASHSQALNIPLAEQREIAHRRMYLLSNP